MSLKALEVFFSYSHNDESLRDELALHLSILKRQGEIASWHDRMITAGGEWVAEINTHINTADIILLLVSPAFVASDYCYDIELKRAMERHEAGEAQVIPIILRPVDWSSSPFGKLQPLPENALPVTSWSNRDEAFVNVTKGIKAVLQAHRASPPVQALPLKKILILTANPKEASRLHLDHEVREISEGLQRSRSRDQFVIAQRWAVSPKDIRRAMLDFQPQIVHFSSFGAEDAWLSFEDEAGQTKLLEPEALAGLFKLFAGQVECVLLNACYSESQAEAIAQHIDYVIGMSQAIGSSAALEFAVGFYDALAAGRSVEFAYRFGCAAIQLAGVSEYLIPVLKSKQDRQLFNQFLRVTQQFLEQAEAKFLQQAQVKTISSSKRSLQIVSLPGRLKSYEPLPVLLVTEQPTDQDVIELMQQATQLVEKRTNCVGILLYTEPPDALFQMRMAEVRLRHHFVLIPILLAEVEKIILEGNASAGLLAVYAERYLPGADLFNDRNAIGDTLSFFGRSKLLHDLKNDLERSQGIGLFGLRKSGKTSLLLQLGFALHEHPVVHIDLQPYGARPYYGAELFNKIIKQLSKFISNCDSQFVDTFKPFAHDIPAVMVATKFVERVDELSQAFKNARYRFPLICFLDEVERILPFDTDPQERVEEFNAFFGALRDLSQVKKKLSLLVADVHPDCNRIDSWKQKGVATNPVFSFFKEVFVSSFSQDETTEMLTAIGKLMGVEFDEATLTTIHQESGGHPFIARQLASLLYQKSDKEKSDKGELIKFSAATRYLNRPFKHSGILKGYFEQSIWADLQKRNFATAMAILRLLACNEKLADGVTEDVLLARLLGKGFNESESTDALQWLEAVGLMAHEELEDNDSFKNKLLLMSRWLQMQMKPEDIRQWQL